jgi:hypothetical protein
MQKFVLLFCAGWLLCACGQATVTEPPTTTIQHTPVPSTATTATPIPLAELTPPEARNEADLTVQQQLQALGYGAADIEYIARTGVTAQQRNPTTWHVMMTTPTGHLIDQTISYAIGKTADIAQPIQRVPPSSDAPGSFAYSYTISAKEAPPEILEAVQSAPAAYRPSRMMMIDPPLRVAVDVEAILVNVKGFIKQYGKDKFGDFTKEYDKLVPDGKFKLNDRWNTVKASMYVLDAVWMFEKVWPYLNALDYLQACAEKPWNPLTKKSYKDFPQDKQRILDRIESTRTEIKYEGLYMYTVVMNKVLLMGIPGLSTVTKFLFGETLNSLIAETEQRLKNLVAEMEKMVTPCNGWRFVQETSADYPFSFEGTKCGGIDGYWTIDDDSNFESARIISKIEITISEEEWINGKKDFRYVFEQSTTTEETVGETMLQGFTKNIILNNQTVQFVLNRPVTCSFKFSPDVGMKISGCETIMKYTSMTSPPDYVWVEDASICQAEKADMMRYENWQP